jgi:DNA-binding NarL/FixJ family response regulator
MKILIADDHWVVRESLKQVTKQLSRNLQPLEASDFNEVMAILEQHQDIGLMLIDLIMPGFKEFEGLRQLRASHPQIPIVIISIHDDPEYVLEAISHGAIGYIPKSAGAEEIIRSLTRVISGEVSFPRYILERSGIGAARPLARKPAPDNGAKLDVLTSRERDVLALLGAGTSAAKIALKLSISPQTVRVHIGNAMKKLDLKTREETIHFAVNHARQLAGEA